MASLCCLYKSSIARTTGIFMDSNSSSSYCVDGASSTVDLDPLWGIVMSQLKDFAAAFQSFATVVGAVVAAYWAYYRFGLGQERYPHIETAADIQFIGMHKNFWIVELVAYVENKGRAQHKMAELNFELSSINKKDSLEDAEQFGGQVLFP